MARSPVLLLLILFITIPIWICLGGMFFGLTMGFIGVIVGLIGAIFGAFFGILGGIFHFLFGHHHFFGKYVFVALIIVIAIVLSKRAKKIS